MIRRRVIVNGRVQGVFFRETCKRVAQQHGVKGSASNLDDGRVEVVLEGDDDAVSRVIGWCRQGPPQASVDSIEVRDEEPRGEETFRTD